MPLLIQLQAQILNVGVESLSVKGDGRVVHGEMTSEENNIDTKTQEVDHQGLQAWASEWVSLGFKVDCYSLP